MFRAPAMSSNSLMKLPPPMAMTRRSHTCRNAVRRGSDARPRRHDGIHDTGGARRIARETAEQPRDASEGRDAIDLERGGGDAGLSQTIRCRLFCGARGEE